MNFKNRETSTDLQNSYKRLNDQLTALYNRTNDKLHYLTNKFPNAIITTHNNTEIKAKAITNMSFIKELTFEEKIIYIRAIEKHIESLNPFKQTEINF